MRKICVLAMCLLGLAFGEDVDPRCGILAKASESYRDSLKYYAQRAMDDHFVYINQRKEENRIEILHCRLIKICESEYYCIVGSHLTTENSIFKIIEDKDVLYLDSIQKYFN